MYEISFIFAPKMFNRLDEHGNLYIYINLKVHSKVEQTVNNIKHKLLITNICVINRHRIKCFKN